MQGPKLRLAGYEDTNDAERLSVDTVIHYVIGERAKDKMVNLVRLLMSYRKNYVF
jgi:hypothetical protein